jgi:excisionase family DNA binding protein
MNNTIEREEVMTLQEVARLLHLSPATVYTLARKRSLPGLKVGRKWRFSRAAVMETLRQPQADAKGCEAAGAT